MVCYRDISFGEVSIIKEVWERNRRFHEEISHDFKELYSDVVFEERMEGFSAFGRENIKITIAEDDSRVLGYCISTFEKNRGGPQTLHVLEEARGRGIGMELMKRHMEWFKVNGCDVVTVTASCDNSHAIGFYHSLGFRPNTIEMRLK